MAKAPCFYFTFWVHTAEVSVQFSGPCQSNFGLQGTLRIGSFPAHSCLLSSSLDAWLWVHRAFESIAVISLPFTPRTFPVGFSLCLLLQFLSRKKLLLLFEQPLGSCYKRVGVSGSAPRFFLLWTLMAEVIEDQNSPQSFWALNNWNHLFVLFLSISQ
jgi:hypothetical protein